LGGALIFILATFLIPHLLEEVRVGDFVLIGVVILAAIAARVGILYGLLPLITALRASPEVERPYRVAILWAGLRGAVTLALALALTESFRVPLGTRRLVDRLSACRRHKVLLIEAGGSDRRFWIKVPLGYARTFRARAVAWRYTAEADPGLGGREAHGRVGG